MNNKKFTAKELQQVNSERSALQTERFVFMRCIPVLTLGVRVDTKGLVIFSFSHASLEDMRTMLQDYIDDLDRRIKGKG